MWYWVPFSLGFLHQYLSGVLVQFVKVELAVIGKSLWTGGVKYFKQTKVLLFFILQIQNLHVFPQILIEGPTVEWFWTKKEKRAVVDRTTGCWKAWKCYTFQSLISNTLRDKCVYAITLFLMISVSVNNFLINLPLSVATSFHLFSPNPLTFLITY